MSSRQETLDAVQKVLEPYIRPREEASQIRRILGLHLESCVEGGTVSSPLSLVEATGVSPSSESCGLQREYLRALSANIAAQTEHNAILNGNNHAAAASSTNESVNTNYREQHLAAIKLRRKQEKLQVIEKYLDLLSQKPAASPRFLDPDEIFQDSRPVPDVPKEVVEGLALNGSVAKTDLNGLIDQLERHVLRAKLLLRQEEDLLESIKSRSSARPENISASAKLDALNATRNELINWIESELGKASSDGADGQEGGSRRQQHMTGANIDEQVVGIKEKYSRYIAARKSLLQTINQSPQPVIKPQTDGLDQEIAPSSVPEPTTHIISPYLENLLALSHEQKGLITEKSHLNVAIAKQLKENRQVLDHLAEESQLLPGHPMPGATSRRQPGSFNDAIPMSENLNTLSRVRPWVFAADSAKIATLEAVAEKIEEGQLALEGSMKALSEIDQLLGRQPAQEGPTTEGNTADEDIWLTESQPPGKSTGGARKHTEQKSEDVWETLNGALGLLGAEDDLP